MDVDSDDFQDRVEADRVYRDKAGRALLVQRERAEDAEEKLARMRERCESVVSVLERLD